MERLRRAAGASKFLRDRDGAIRYCAHRCRRRQSRASVEPYCVDLCYEIHPAEDLHDGLTFETFLDSGKRLPTHRIDVEGASNERRIRRDDEFSVKKAVLRGFRNSPTNSDSRRSSDGRRP